MSTRKELALNLVRDARAFRACGPSDDPDRQTADTTGYHYLVTQFKRLVAPILSENAASRLNAVDVEFNDIYSVYRAIAEIDALLPDIEDALKVVDDDLRSIAAPVETNCWRAGWFRLFITHLSAHRRLAAELQERLQNFGVSSFVAHNDIEPTLEWQNEIEAALSTCDALAALLHPNFHLSSWVDQEIGFAMGRRVPVVTVRLGQDPYGFVGKFQAFDGLNKDASKLASELFDAFRRGKRTRFRISEGLIQMFADSNSYREARANLRVLGRLIQWDPSFASRLRSAVQTNRQISEADGVSQSVEALIEKWSR